MNVKRMDMLQVQDRSVFLRSDLHLAFDSSGSPTRERYISSFLPGIRMLSDRGAVVVLAGHRNGKNQSLKELAPVLSSRLGKEVTFVSNPFSEDAPATIQGGTNGSIFLCENLLLNEGEAKNKQETARKLAQLSEFYVNDAFDASRFSYASIVGIPALLPSFAGSQLIREITSLRGMKSGVERPFVIVLGGNQLENKIRIMRHFVASARNHVDAFLIGGGIAYTFLKSRAVPIGQSLLESKLEVEAFQAIEKSELVETSVSLPIDHLVAENYSPDARVKSVRQNDIPDRWMALDIGAKTSGLFEKAMKKASTVLWYGPLGAVELDAFRKSTISLGKTLSRSKAFTIVAGEDTQNTLENAGLLSGFSHWTTSSASMTEFITGNGLPGLDALEASSKIEE